MLPVFSHPFRLLCVHPLRRKMDNIFKYYNTSLIVSCSQQWPTELPGDRCNNYGNSVQSSFKQYAICWTRFRRINCFLLLFAFLEQKITCCVFAIQCCSHGSYFPHSLGAWVEAVWTYFVWRHRWDDEFSWIFFGDCVVFFISIYGLHLCATALGNLGNIIYPCSSCRRWFVELEIPQGVWRSAVHVLLSGTVCLVCVRVCVCVCVCVCVFFVCMYVVYGSTVCVYACMCMKYCVCCVCLYICMRNIALVCVCVCVCVYAL